MAYFVKYMFDTSTHDLHTEVDAQDRHIRNGKGTSTHDLHTEVDDEKYLKEIIENQLQLTTSTRRSTIFQEAFDQCFGNFNSRPPHGGRLTELRQA